MMFSTNSVNLSWKHTQETRNNAPKLTGVQVPLSGCWLL